MSPGEAVAEEAIQRREPQQWRRPGWWRRLFAGTVGALRVVVDLLPESAHPTEVEGLPLLDPAFARVDAVLAFQGTKNLNVLALADCLSHGRALPEDAMTYAASRGVDRDVRYLEDHRRREGRVVRADEVREAHQRAVGAS